MSNFQAFLTEIEDKLDVIIDPYICGPNMYGAKAEEKPKAIIGVQWSTGSVSGGSCWDDGESDNHYYESGNVEPELKCLDIVLEHFCPNITFLQYKALTAKLVENGTHSEDEYYGNHTDYAQKTVSLIKLYTYLGDKEWLPKQFV